MLPALIAAEEGDINPLLPADYDIIWSAILFAIILVFFFVLVVPRLNKVLDARSDAIEGGLKRAEEAQAAAAASRDEYEAALAEARAEAAQIREKARVEGAQILAELKEQASAEAARIAANAQTQIEAERTAALASLRSEVGVLALDLASSVIGERLSDDSKSQAVVDRLLAEIETQGADR